MQTSLDSGNPVCDDTAGIKKTILNMTSITPTDEQFDIINHNLKEKEMLKVLAYAGTGKTSTLIQIAMKYPTKRILYLAYNKSVKEEAIMKFPFNVDVETIHSL